MPKLFKIWISLHFWPYFETITSPNTCPPKLYLGHKVQLNLWHMIPPNRQYISKIWPFFREKMHLLYKMPKLAQNRIFLQNFCQYFQPIFNLIFLPILHLFLPLLAQQQTMTRTKDIKNFVILAFFWGEEGLNFLSNISHKAKQHYICNHNIIS